MIKFALEGEVNTERKKVEAFMKLLFSDYIIFISHSFGEQQ